MDTALITDTAEIMRNGIHPRHRQLPFVSTDTSYLPYPWISLIDDSGLIFYFLFLSCGDNVPSALWVDKCVSAAIVLRTRSLPECPLFLLSPLLFLSPLSFQKIFSPFFYPTFLLLTPPYHHCHHSLPFTLPLSHLSRSLFFFLAEPPRGE